MRLLLDTHAFLWWIGNQPALSRAALQAMSDPANDIFFSAASAWEIAVKHRIGKLPSVSSALVADIETAVANEGFIGLPVGVRHGQVAGQLPGPHKDPFDRMLVAQALEENLMLVSNEKPFDAFGVQRLW